jgi:Asp/Glu/hydantoin racemase
MSIRSAAQGGHSFSIVTLGAAMRGLITSKVAALGFEAELAGVDVLPFSMLDMIADREATRASIVDAVRRCSGEAVLLGGAPFAGMAWRMARLTGKLVLDGVAACVSAIIAD